jgi:hypothetical protein
MPNFTPRPDRSLVRRLRQTDEQLASVFNQSWQAIADNLQLGANILAEITQQVASITDTITTIENSYNTQLSALSTAQSAASPVLATSLQRNTEVNNLNTANTNAVNKTAAANTALTTANNNLSTVASEAQPYNALLNAIAQLGRPNNSMLGTSGTGGATWLLASGQSFTVEMGYVSLRRSAGTDGGTLAVGSFATIPLNTTGYMNARNQFGLVETSLNNNALTLPCTGGDCKYYVWSLANFCGIGGANSRLTLDSALISGGGAVQSIAGRASASEDFNQVSAGFGAFSVGGSSPELRLDAIVQSSHPSSSGVALGRAVGSGSGSEEFASLLFLRRRIL